MFSGPVCVFCFDEFPKESNLPQTITKSSFSFFDKIGHCRQYLVKYGNMIFILGFTINLSGNTGVCTNSFSIGMEYLFSFTLDTLSIGTDR